MLVKHRLAQAEADVLPEPTAQSDQISQTRARPACQWARLPASIRAQLSAGGSVRPSSRSSIAATARICRPVRVAWAGSS